MIYQIHDAMISISARDRLHFNMQQLIKSPNLDNV